MNAASHAETSPARAKRGELDLAQWRDVFGRLDALLEVPPEDRQRALEQGTLHDDGAVAAVLKDYCQHTTMAHAPLAPGATSATGMPGVPDMPDIAAISRALLGRTQQEPGQRCGNYRLIEPIGQGGMGSVWRGERIDGLYQSQVAVKLLGSLALSAHARARFAREGDLLARLTHPNIARLLDAGLTEDHQRFLVLELVVGQDITTFAKAAALDQRATVALFRQVLAAVAFAHSQLVVHRDIKPGNVMVTTSGQVKLLDFGVAKLLDSDEAEDNLTRVVGAAYTEAYAAPEQLRGDAVGTAADVFSLGSLLHQLLAYVAPQWPIAKRELSAGMQPLPVANASIPTDLRAIMMKALAVAPDERYATVAAFDDDLGRFLSGEAVRAQPATRFYQFRKFLSRHRWSALAGAAASIAVIASLGVALWQLQEAREQRAQAVQEASRANEVTSFLTGLFRASDLRTPSAQDKRTLTARQLIDAGREQLKTELNDHPETKVALLGILAEVYGIMGESERFVELNGERIKLATEKLGPMHPAVLLGRFTDAEADLYTGKYDSARSTLLDLQQPYRSVYGEKSERYAYWLATLADLDRRAGKEPIASVLARFEQSLAIFSALKSKTEEHAIATQNYATALASANRFDDSLAASGRAIAIFETLKNFDAGGLAITYDRRAQLLQQMGRSELAGAQYEKALALIIRNYGEGGALHLNTLLSKARWLHGQGRRTEAWALVDQVVATPRPPSSDTLGIHEQHYVRGTLLLNEGKFGDAAADLMRAVNGWRDAGNHPQRLRAAEEALAKAQVAMTRR